LGVHDVSNETHVADDKPLTLILRQYLKNVCIIDRGGGKMGVERGQMPPSTSKFFYILGRKSLGCPVAHPQPQIKGNRHPLIKHKGQQLEQCWDIEKFFCNRFCV
jgi:hypothetical protein